MAVTIDIPADLNRLFANCPPKNCLCVGGDVVLSEFLESFSSAYGQNCAVYTINSSDGEKSTFLQEAAYHVPGSALASSEFPKLRDVISFAETQKDKIKDVERFTVALSKAKREVEPNCSALNCIAEDFQLRLFDLVVFSGEEILGGRIVEKLKGSKAFLFNCTKTAFGGSSAFAALFNDVSYQLVSYSDEGDGCALFALRDIAKNDLPINFFTIVLNGEPFIRYHEKMLLELSCPWHWHIVEGVASLVKDTAWSVASGGHIPENLHDEGKSNDGTTEYLDELAKRFPRHITLYRKPAGVFWNGKVEMVSAPISNIKESCLLWQIDSDELWLADQVETVRRKFIEQPNRTAASFWCNYYVGPDRGISTRFNYAQNPQQEWLRVWRFEPGMIWDKHEPPVLSNLDQNGHGYDVGKLSPFTHREMENCGAVFDHFAYATIAQAQFKESYYGYRDAVAQWLALQNHGDGSGHLRDYFAWVSDETMFDTVRRLDWDPIAYVDPDDGQWKFRDSEEMRTLVQQRIARPRIKIVIDGVFFQLANSGIARVWINILREWSRSGFGEQVVLLDRAGTAPRMDGIIYRTIDLHNWNTIDGDSKYLQEICDREKADLFISTYYTTPTRTPSVFFGHDMIPEVMGFDLDDVWWRQKRRAIQYAAGHVMVSENSVKDLCDFHPDLDRENILVAYNSVDSAFRPRDAAEIEGFRKKYKLDRQFVMLVGERFGWKGYKNASVVFAALRQIPIERRPLLVCVGGAPKLEDICHVLLDEEDVRLVRLDDNDLCLCYASALGYICPSMLEGFGLPIAEAMTVGCPALVCPNSSIPEVAGEAGIYFDANDPGSLVVAIERLGNPTHRSAAIEAGWKQVKKFDLGRSAQHIAEYCRKTIEQVRSGEIRRNEQTLEDSFRFAEQARSAKMRVDELEREIFDTKLKLSSAVRIKPGGKPNFDDAYIDNSEELMIAIERRLAAAYMRLYALDESSTDPRKRLLTSTTRQLSHIDTIGLSQKEGPYPQLHIERAFQWQILPKVIIIYHSSSHSDAWFEIEFSNAEHNQVVHIYANGQLVQSASVPDIGWEHTWRIAVPISIVSGANHIEVKCDRFAQPDGDLRALYLAVYDFAVNFDFPAVPNVESRDFRDLVAVESS